MSNVKKQTGLQCICVFKHDFPGFFSVLCLPGLTLEESIDIELLCKKLCSLEQLVKDLHLAKKTRYTSRDQKKQLKVQLASKSKAKDHVVEKNTQLKARFVSFIFICQNKPSPLLVFQKETRG